MTDGLLLTPGAGTRIQSMTLKVGAEQTPTWSAFEAEIGPGFDVGAHSHDKAEEVFYVLEGELDLLAFHPAAEPHGDWLAWQAADGRKVLRGGPGSFMYVPAGCPHAFHNPTGQSARLLFLVSPAGHEDYQRELGALLAAGPPDPDEVAAIRVRHDIRQLTPMTFRGAGG